MRVIALAGGWLLGVFLGAELGLAAALAFGAAGALAAALLISAAAAPRRRWLLVGLAVAGALIGVVRFDLHDGASDPAGSPPSMGRRSSFAATSTPTPNVPGLRCASSSMSKRPAAPAIGGRPRAVCW